MTTTGVQNKTPVPVTRGSKPTILSQKVHWIAGTFKGQQAIKLPLNLTQNSIPCKGYLNYPVGTLFEDGRKMFQAPNNPEWGVHCVWSGTACDNCPVNPLHLICGLICAGFSFTRIDLAIDVKNANLRPCRATEEIENKRHKTRAEKCLTLHDAAGTGYTQYIGQMSSEIYLKLYDKAAEMGTNEDHTRIELTIKSKRANTAARQAVLRQDFRGLVVSFADFPEWDEWREAMAVAPVKLPSQRQETNTRRWLMDACAPALAKVIFLDHDGNEFYAKFIAAVAILSEQMSNNRQTVY